MKGAMQPRVGYQVGEWVLGRTKLGAFAVYAYTASGKSMVAAFQLQGVEESTARVMAAADELLAFVRNLVDSDVKLPPELDGAMVRALVKAGVFGKPPAPVAPS